MNPSLLAPLARYPVDHWPIASARRRGKGPRHHVRCLWIEKFAGQARFLRGVPRQRRGRFPEADLRARVFSCSKDDKLDTRPSSTKSFDEKGRRPTSSTTSARAAATGPCLPLPPPTAARSSAGAASRPRRASTRTVQIAGRTITRATEDTSGDALRSIEIIWAHGLASFIHSDRARHLRDRNEVGSLNAAAAAALLGRLAVRVAQAHAPCRRRLASARRCRRLRVPRREQAKHSIPGSGELPPAARAAGRRGLHAVDREIAVQADSSVVAGGARREAESPFTFALASQRPKDGTRP